MLDDAQEVETLHLVHHHFAVYRPVLHGTVHQPGQRPKSDRLAPKVLALVAEGRSYRLLGHEAGLSKNILAGIMKRARMA